MSKLPKRPNVARLAQSIDPTQTIAPASDVPKFSLSAGSRHPVLGRDYDDRTHRYTTSYINPSSYSIVVNAFPGEEVIRIIVDDPEPDQGGSSNQSGDVQILQLKVPLDTVAVDFSINQIDGQFSSSASNRIGSLQRRSTQKPPFDSWDWQPSVPSEGIYEITVTLRNTSGSGPKNTRTIVLRDFLVVSIGDSSASGQGNPDVRGAPKSFDLGLDWWEVIYPPAFVYDAMGNKFKQTFTTIARAGTMKQEMDQEPIWLEKRAYRSLRSGSARAARSLENLAAGRMVTFLSFARTGSDIRAGLLGPRSGGADTWIGNIGQVQEAKNALGDRRVDALLISIGVNDIGITGTLTNLVKNDIGLGDTEQRRNVRRRAEENLTLLPAAFDDLEAALKALNIRDIYLIEYPISPFDLKDGQPGKGCEIFSSDYFDCDLTPADAQLVKDVAEQLNAALRREAEKRGWFFVTGIAERFGGRGYCTAGDLRCFIKAEESLMWQGDTEGTIHPNAAGHTIIAQQIAAALQKNMLEAPPVWLEPVLHIMMS
jgi:lysophospholipase L1-like esterase